MTAREWLSRYRQAWKEAEDIELRLTQIRLKYTTAGAIQYSDMPKAHRKTDLSDYAAEIERYEGILIAKYQKCIGIEIEIYQAIDNLKSENERIVLRAIYIDGKHYREIAEMVPCVVRSVHRYHQRGLSHIGQYLSLNVTT